MTDRHASRRPKTAPVPFWLLLAVVLAAIPNRSEAYSGSVFRLPQGPATPKNGLQLVIDTRWVEANGYRPVRIEAVNWPPGPATADRSIRVVLQPRSWQWGRGATRVTGYVEIPEGATRGQTTLAVPQSGAWGSLDFWVYEDGQLLEDLSPPSMGMGIGMRAYHDHSEALPAILIVDADAPPRTPASDSFSSGPSTPRPAAMPIPRANCRTCGVC